MDVVAFKVRGATKEIWSRNVVAFNVREYTKGD